MQAVIDAGGVTVVVLVYVAPNVITFVVVAYPSLSLVLVGVGRVVVMVRMPESTVGAGMVDVLVVLSRTVSVVVVASAVSVVVVGTGVS